MYVGENNARGVIRLSQSKVFLVRIAVARRIYTRYSIMLSRNLTDLLSAYSGY